MSLKNQLAAAKKLWVDAKSKKPDFGNEVPDGTYVGKLVKAAIGESQASGRLQVAFQATISSGEHKGENVYWYSGLKTEENFMYLQRDIVRLGKDVPEDINEIGEVLEGIAESKPSIRFKVVTNGEFQNVRLLKKLTAEESGEDEPEVPVEEPEEPEAEVEETPVVEPEAEPEPEPEAFIEIGMRVMFQSKGKDVLGEVASVDEKTETVRVKSDAGPVFKLKADQLQPAPKTKVKKK